MSKRRKEKFKSMDNDIERALKGQRPKIEALLNQYVDHCNGDCKKENPRNMEVTPQNADLEGNT